jgi:hypothetical protein
MATSSPIRIDDELYAAAKVTGEVLSRSAANQIAHWARLGRALEASPSLAAQDVVAVLAGNGSYDALGMREQAVVRSAWSDRIADRLSGLDLAEEFAREPRDYVELDEDGAVAHRTPAAAKSRKRTAAKPRRRTAPRVVPG